MAEPEELRSVGFGRARRVTLNTKESSVSQIAKRRETGRITALSHHTSTPLLSGGSNRPLILPSHVCKMLGSRKKVCLFKIEHALRMFRGRGCLGVETMGTMG